MRACLCARARVCVEGVGRCNGFCLTEKLSFLWSWATAILFMFLLVFVWGFLFVCLFFVVVVVVVLLLFFFRGGGGGGVGPLILLDFSSLLFDGQ